MNAEQEIVAGMAFRIAKDIEFGLWPNTMITGRRWLRRAIVWAKRKGYEALATEITELLGNAICPEEKRRLPAIRATIIPAVALPMGTRALLALPVGKQEQEAAA